MRAFMFTFIVLAFLFSVPFFYLKKHGLEGRPRAYIPEQVEEGEQSYRNEMLERVLATIPEELKARVASQISPLRTSLPRAENNRIVEEVQNSLKEAGAVEAAELISSLYIYWEPNPKKVEAGRILYQNRCMACHGRSGDGIPVTPEGLKTNTGNPIYPRDFTGKYHKDGKVVFKYGHRGMGKDRAYLQDLKQTIRMGLPGTPMPGFPELTEDEVDALLEYIRSLAPVAWKFFPAETTFSSVMPPLDLGSATRVERGRSMFLAACAACHGNQEAGSEPLKGLTLEWYAYNEKREVLKDASGKTLLQPVTPRNFVREPLSRPGPEGIYSTIRYGLGGTPMAGFSFPDDTIWDLVSYILWLRGSKHATP